MGNMPASPASSPPAGPATAPAPASSPPVPSSTPSASAEPVFQASTSVLSEAMRTRMTGVSRHPGCPVSLAQLRLLRLSYWGFDHAVHQGELIVNASAAASLTQAFRQLFAARFDWTSLKDYQHFSANGL